MKFLNDTELTAMAIPGRNAYLDELQAQYEEAEARSEIDAEMAIERYFESRGYDEARAQEDYERSLGINVYI